MLHHLADIAAQFDVAGRLLDARPFGHGHIHDSYVLEFAEGAGRTRRLLQRINTHVFPEPEQVMENIRRVTEHVAARLTEMGTTDMQRRTLRVAKTRDGAALYTDPARHCWRMYNFVERSRTHATVSSPAMAEQAGHRFGLFQRLLVDLPGPRLAETIPAFHETPKRYEYLDRAIQEGTRDRVAAAKRDIAFAEAQRPLARRLADAQRTGALPERIVHNDAKIDNVLFDEQTGEALCVVDLDTVMPGLALNDFGDMVRTMAVTAAEDETDLARVEIDLTLFEAMARGYLREASSFLTSAERENLVLAGRLITLEQGVRFLADFLIGDVYYKTCRPRHNLDRCRTQFKLVKSIAYHDEAMRRIVEHLWESMVHGA